MTILLGKGDGTFQPEVTTYGTGQGAESVIAADLTGGGNLDLATCNQGSGTVSVLMGNGNGTFQPAVNYAVGPDPWSIVDADFTGDREPDLAVLDKDSGSVSVLLNKGDGTFGQFDKPPRPASLTRWQWSRAISRRMVTRTWLSSVSLTPGALQASSSCPGVGEQGPFMRRPSSEASCRARHSRSRPADLTADGEGWTSWPLRAGLGDRPA